MRFVCQQYENKFRPFGAIPWFSRTIHYTFLTDGSLIYSLKEINDKTGLPWGMKLFYIGEFQPHNNSVNFSFSQIDKLILNAYGYRDQKLFSVPIGEISPNRSYDFYIDATGNRVRWIVNGNEKHRIDNWKPRITWLQTPFYGTSGNDPYPDGSPKPRASAPHKMSMEIQFVNNTIF